MCIKYGHEVFKQRWLWRCSKDFGGNPRTNVSQTDQFTEWIIITELIFYSKHILNKPTFVVLSSILILQWCLNIYENWHGHVRAERNVIPVRRDSLKVCFIYKILHTR